MLGQKTDNPASANASWAKFWSLVIEADTTRLEAEKQVDLEEDQQKKNPLCGQGTSGLTISLTDSKH